MATTRSDKEELNLPSTAEVTQGIQAVKSELKEAKHAPGVDNTGRRILADTERVLDSAQHFIEEKNKGDVVQEMITEGKKAIEELQSQVEELTEKGKAKVEQIDIDKLKAQAARTLETARNSGFELISSQAFRKAIRDFLYLMYDIVSDSFEMEGQEGQLRQGRRRRRGRGARQGGEQHQQQGGARTYVEAVRGEGSQQQGQQKEGQREPAIQQAAENTKETIRENIDTSEMKRQIEEPINKGLKAARIPGRVRLNKEQLDELVNRFTHFIDNLSKDERLSRMFRELLHLFDLFSSEIGLQIPTSRKMRARLEQGQAPSKEEMKEAGKQIGDKAMEKAKEAGNQLQQAVTQTAEEMRHNRHLQRALALSKELFERFTNGKSLDDLLDHFFSLYRVIIKDAQALNIYQELRKFLDRVLEDPTILKGDEGKREFRRFVKRFRRIETKKIQNHLSKALDEANDLLASIQNDPATKRLRDDMKRLLNDLVLDEHGQFTWKPEVLDQMRVLLVRAVIERMRIPLPRIRSVDGTMVYKISNMMIDVKDILPEKVTIEETARIKLDLSQLGDKSKPILSDATSRLRINMKNINLNIKDMDVRFKRLSFPKVSDRGRARLDLADEGMDIHIQLAIHPGTYRIFRVEDLHADVHQVNLELYDTSHDFLYSMFLPFIRNRVRTDIEDGVEHMIRLYLDQLNRMAAKQMRKMSEQMSRMTEGGQYNIYSFARRISDALPSAPSLPSMEDVKSTFHDISDKLSTVSEVTKGGEGESAQRQEPSPKKKRTTEH